MEFTYLKKNQVLAMHRFLIQEYGGPHGLRDEGLLDSALAQPRQTAFGEDVYPNVYLKAAVYAFGLSENQPFLDGNKRIAVSVMATFLAINGIEITGSPIELYEVIMNTANKKTSKEKLAQWLKIHSDSMS